MADISVELREGVGKGAARQTRREGFVPGVIYGGGEDPVAIKVKFNELIKMLSKGQFLSTLHHLDVDGNRVRVVARNIQRDVVKDLPTHIDFLRLARGQKINLAIPVEFLNQETSKGIKRGGNLVVVRPEVELVVPADDIPESIQIDLADRVIGDVIHISDFELPAGVKPTITDRDFVVANISAPTILLDDEDDTEADTDASAEVPTVSETKEGDEE